MVWVDEIACPQYDGRHARGAKGLLHLNPDPALARHRALRGVFIPARSRRSNPRWGAEFFHRVARGLTLTATCAGNLVVIFDEPDIRIADAAEGMATVQVFGVDVFKPQTGAVPSKGTEGIALWMLDTDYTEESFFVRHACFLGANDPDKALRTTLKAEIDEEAWDSLCRSSRRCP